MEQKIGIVTGANSGIGFVTAKALAQAGFHTVLVCRNTQKAEIAKGEIQRAIPQAVVSIITCDFADQVQIRQAVEAFKAQFSRLDVLVNNAGYMASGGREVTADGYEKTFAVNHLGYFMFTRLLEDVLKQTQGARVVSVSSEAHRIGRINFNDLFLEKGYSDMNAYANSKLANIVFTHELAKRLKGSGVTANCLHPGVVASNFAANLSGSMAFLFSIAKPFMISSEKGAETSIYLALSPDVANVSGQYFVRKRLKTPKAQAFDAEVGRKLWEISNKLTHLPD